MVQFAFQPDGRPPRFLPHRLDAPARHRREPVTTGRPHDGDRQLGQGGPTRRVEVRPHREVADPRIRLYLQHADLAEDWEPAAWEVYSIDLLV